MKYKTLILEKREHERLKRIMAMGHYLNDKTYRASISKLHEELEHAKVVKAEKMPDDVIRFDSMVTIETPFGPAKTYQLVTPEKSDIKQNKISILAPMGSALIGYAKGDEVDWHFPSGPNVIKIVDVVQPKKELSDER